MDIQDLGLQKSFDFTYENQDLEFKHPTELLSAPMAHPASFMDV